MLRHLKISVKLPLLVVLVAVVALYLAEFIASSNARYTVLQDGSDRLLAVARSRAAEIGGELALVRADIQSKLDNPVILDAARAFVTSWHLHGPAPEVDLRNAYITDNPHRLSDRAQLTIAQDGSAYSLVHRRYHPFFRNHLGSRSYDDIYLISPEGRIVYSVQKRDAFGRDVTGHDYTDTGLALAFRRAVRGAGFSRDVMTGFMPFPGPDDPLSAFFATAVRSDFGTLEGVVVIRMPMSRLNDITARPEGLGATGSAIVLGQKPGVRSAATPGRPAPDLPPADALASWRKSGWAQTHLHTGADGTRFVTAHATVGVSNRTLFVLAQQPEADILMPAALLRSEMLRDGALALMLVTVLGVMIARSISIPLGRLGIAMSRVADRNFEDAIPERDRGDDIGEMARRLDALRANLVEADGVARENAFKGAAFEAASAALMLVDRDLTIIYVNEALEALMLRHQIVLGRNVGDIRPDALAGRNLTSLFPGAERLRDALERGEAHCDALRLGQAQFALDMALIRGRNGAVLGYVVEWSDRTEAEWTRAVLGSIDAQLPMAGFSPDGRLIHANALFDGWTGLGPHTPQGRHWNMIFSVRRGPATGDCWEAMAATGAERVAVHLRPTGRGMADALQCILCRVAGRGKHVQRYVLVATGAGAASVSDRASAAHPAPAALARQTLS